MELALYQPVHGYYLGATVRSAREGDFLTAAELHPIFGRVLARQLTEMWGLLDRPPAFTLREYGAGPGTLALAIFEGLRADRSHLLEAVVYQPTELNPVHRQTLAERLSASGFAHLFRRVEGPPVVGCVLATEFIDALPVHRVQGTDDGLREVFVTWRDGWFSEEPAEPSIPELAAYFERLGIGLRPGQRAEVNLAMGGWLDEVARDLRRGYLLVIDYGHPAAQLYSEVRTGGTLRAYRAHTAHDDPFRFVGRQDLTAHVDFTILGQWAGDRGLVPLRLTTQARFLVAAGLEGLLEAERSRPGLDAEGYLALRASIVRLLDPRAMGAFGVFLLGRRVPGEPLPSGLRGAEAP